VCGNKATPLQLDRTAGTRLFVSPVVVHPALARRFDGGGLAELGDDPVDGGVEVVAGCRVAARLLGGRLVVAVVVVVVAVAAAALLSLLFFLLFSFSLLFLLLLVASAAVSLRAARGLLFLRLGGGRGRFVAADRFEVLGGDPQGLAADLGHPLQEVLGEAPLERALGFGRVVGTGAAPGRKAPGSEAIRVEVLDGNDGPVGVGVSVVLVVVARLVVSAARASVGGFFQCDLDARTELQKTKRKEREEERRE